MDWSSDKIKSAIRYGMKRHGWDLRRFPSANDVDGQVVALLRANDVDCVVDVGANQGQFARSLRELNYAGRIISFEPEPNTFQTLSRLAEGDEYWEVRNLGLGDKPSTLTLHVSNSTDMSSLLDINENYLGWNHDYGKVVGDVMVEISTLDSQTILGERLFIKTDTQGYDRRVLTGGSATMGRAVGLLTEMAVIPNYDNADNEWSSMLTFVLSQGFQPAGFFTIDRNDKGQVREMDGLFVRM